MQTEVTESKTGRFPAMSFDAYKSIDGVSASTLRALYLSTPAHAVTGKEATSFMEFGAALHCLTLEPQQFPARFWLYKKYNKRKKAERADHLKACEDNAPRQPILEADFYSMQRIADAIRDHPVAGPLVKKSTHEESIVWEEHFGLCKARVDMVGDGLPWLADLKSCQSAHPKDFSWSIVPSRKEYGNLWIQAAWYYRGARALGMKANEFHFIAVESAAPHGITVHSLEEPELQSVQDQLTRLAETWRECLSKSDYPAYAPVKNVISLEEGE